MINNKNKNDISEEEIISEINQILKDIDKEWSDILKEEKEEKED